MEQNSRETTLSDFVMTSMIGKGAFSKVYRAIHKPTNQEVAIKIIPITEKNSREILEEISTTRDLKHPYVAELYEILEDKDNNYLIMEYLPNGNLCDYIKQQGALSEDEAQFIFFQIVSAVSYLHSNNIIHRDIKAENILLDKNNNIRLIDFGLSKHMSDKSDQCKTLCGTAAYCAPEIILGRMYNESVDIWSLGILLYMMLNKRLPFVHSSVMGQMNLITNTSPEIPNSLSSSAQDLLNRMLNKDPSNRITLNEVLYHPWIEDQIFNIEKVQELIEKKKNIQNSIISHIGLKFYDTDGIVKEIENNEKTKRVMAYKLLKNIRFVDQLCKSVKRVPDLPTLTNDALAANMGITRVRRQSNCFHQIRKILGTKENHPLNEFPNSSKNIAIHRRNSPIIQSAALIVTDKCSSRKNVF